MIDVFNAQGRKIQEIQAAVAGLATDSYGNLFVATTNEPYVSEYTPPYNGRPIEIAIPKSQGAYGVAVDAKTGVVAVITYTQVPPNTPYFISFYRHGSTKPCDVISTKDSPLQTFGPGAFDAEGTLYFLGSQGETSNIVASLAGQCSAKNVQIYSFAQPIFVGSLAFDKNDDLVIPTYNDGPALIYTYKLPSGKEFSLPIAATSLSPYGTAATGFLALASDGQHLWAASAHAVLQGRYPGINTTAWNLIIPNLPYPVEAAVVPPLVP